MLIELNSKNNPIKNKGIDIQYKTNRFSKALKKKTVIILKIIINKEPSNSHLKTIKFKANKINQGKELGKLVIIPLIPSFTTPENKEQTKNIKEIINNNFLRKEISNLLKINIVKL